MLLKKFTFNLVEKKIQLVLDSTHTHAREGIKKISVGVNLYWNVEQKVGI